MKNSFLVAINDSMISRTVLDHLIGLSCDPDNIDVTLLHIFRKPTAEVELMGKKFAAEQQPRIMAALEKAKDKLIENGFREEKITINLVTENYPTVTDGIIDQFNKGDYNMVMIGRKRMSKSEEFVLGDISIKLVRALEGTGIIVVKT
ncbi:MAG: universal stress protein [Proteobacteria bacterium]|nr:universal stress protein [Pseudomonadota bacterium]